MHLLKLQKQNQHLKEVAVVSGERGEGRSSLVASFATLAKKAVMVDCDLEKSALRAIMEFAKCNDALPIRDTSCGKISIKETRYGPLIYPKPLRTKAALCHVIFNLRQKARELAREDDIDFVLIKCPASVDKCVATAIAGVNLVLMVVDHSKVYEQRWVEVFKLTRYLNIPAVICLNKCSNTDRPSSDVMGKYIFTQELELVGRIRFDQMVARATSLNSSVIEYTGAAISQEIKKVWENINIILNTPSVSG